jgi:predicted DNA-binding transcriptional regulator AlpA
MADADRANVAEPAREAHVLLNLVGVLARLADAVEQQRMAAAEGLDPGAAAAFIGVSISKLHDLNTRGLMPSPAELGDGGRCPRWSRSELRAWLLAGAPSRIRWQAMRDQVMRRAG